VKHFYRSISLMILFLFAVGITYAQDSTPEVTPEATSETTPLPTIEFPGAGAFTISGGTVAGFERSYRVYIPESYETAEAPVPLLFVFHGAGGTGVNMAKISAFNEIADVEGFVVVYPDGINYIWNDGRPPDPNIGPVDDIAFVSEMLRVMTASLNIDPARIYATGYSAGGMFSYRLGCEMSDQFAAVASVASTFPVYLNTNCEGTPPVPLLVIQGTDDPVVPWMGYKGGYLSAEDTLDYWQAHNGCESIVPLTPIDDTDPDDGTRILTEGRGECENGADVLLYGVFFGGHTWPSHPIEAPFDLGPTSMDVDASQVIWEFFAAHPKP
jgi:polyhydroxybutyrate depolymerase